MNLPFIQCRACSSSKTRVVLDLGRQPLANRLVCPENAGLSEPRFPLRVLVCENCWLLQIEEVVNPQDLFSQYVYFSSFSDHLLAHAKSAAERYLHEFRLTSSQRVVEVASNDGYLLQHFKNTGIPCLGIEPARNIAQVACEKGIDTIVDFFDSRLAGQLKEQGFSADLILGNNVFAHVPAINDFVAGLAVLLRDRGRVILEFPYAVDLIEKSEFDTIYHEHVFYFSLTALVPLFQRHHLPIFRVERLAIHGGSLRIFASHSGAYKVDTTVAQVLEAERERGVPSLTFYEGFSAQVAAIKAALVSLIARLRDQGKNIAGYGASAKGSILLNFTGLGKDQISFVADRSPHKQGLLMPGVHIPIVDTGRLLRDQPDYTVLLTWNFAEEILAQQSEYRQRGGKFIVPIPQVEIC